MTFQNIQDRVMGRLNLSSPEARTRIKEFINERNRMIATSTGLGKVRRTSSDVSATTNVKTYTPANIIKIYTISIPAQNIVLGERSQAQIRLMDPDESNVGVPRVFAILNYGATSVTYRLWPTPDAGYTTKVDALVAGTDLSANGDVPAFPEDYHDILVFLASADELNKMEKPKLSDINEAKGQARLGELRYFLAKSAYLNTVQGSNFWWTGPWGGRHGWILP